MDVELVYETGHDDSSRRPGRSGGGSCRQAQDAARSLTTVVQAALRDTCANDFPRKYLVTGKNRTVGRSGRSDVGAEHDAVCSTPEEMKRAVTGRRSYLATARRRWQRCAPPRRCNSCRTRPMIAGRIVVAYPTCLRPVRWCCFVWARLCRLQVAHLYGRGLWLVNYQRQKGTARRWCECGTDGRAECLLTRGCGDRWAAEVEESDI